MQKFVYTFSQGDASLKSLLGGKGANLSEMTKLDVPVPPGFIITTEACNYYLQNDKHFPDNMWNDVLDNIKLLESRMGKKFGSSENPLLVSVRSGAAVSMPGMMDTVLNLGLNEATTSGLAKKTGNEAFAYDSYRRFIQMYSNVVLGIDHDNFEEILDNKKKQAGVEIDNELSVEDLKSVIKSYKSLVYTKIGMSFPDDPIKQLERAVMAVFYSWQTPRAVKYREIHKIPHDMGTAVNIQCMVFGNMGTTSGTGVAFTRDPSTGENKLFGEFLMNAQGEDVVAGIRTPEKISYLESVSKDVFDEFKGYCDKLENHFKDMQDIEFTIEQSNLYILQTRNGKRSAFAGVKIAVDMEDEGLIDKKTALLRVDPNKIDQLLHPMIDDSHDKKFFVSGIPASPGAACGKAYFTALDAEKAVKNGEKVILIRYETSPEDIGGMSVSQGILTACGGATSHAAVVARGMGIACVSGAADLLVNPKSGKATAGGVEIKKGDFITIDGSKGECYLGECKMKIPKISGNFEKVLKWSDEYSVLKVRTNADTPEDARKAREFGAEGIGLCRTEHMFFDKERIGTIREMILSSDVDTRSLALNRLLPFQKTDFKGIFEAMNGLPVTIRLLDPPLHEFLPHSDSDIEALSKQMGISYEQVKDKVISLKEVNPMLGHRGCRLMMTYPEIVEMQTRAIVEASVELRKNGISALPEIMIPLVGLESEFVTIKKIIEGVIREVFMEQDYAFEIPIGTMIELPRACITAGHIAKHADFFSFGTNDLTQMTFGYSRDDVGKFLPEYIEKKYLDSDPFQTIDTKGVGTLIQIGVRKGRGVKKNLKIGICGEHGGDPDSIDFCYHNDFNYVSCSPFRVPVARISAARSYLKKWETL